MEALLLDEAVLTTENPTDLGKKIRCREDGVEPNCALYQGYKGAAYPFSTFLGFSLYYSFLVAWQMPQQF